MVVKGVVDGSGRVAVCDMANDGVAVGVVGYWTLFDGI